ncbi:Sorting nexin-5 [Trichoplax sp. H2]|nr:Sorting nexin-5 [Trichoplax sp. H2]|eukprot:RDD47089.1 Sorting nexin-5 [Trichoplax sp. H2]
MWIISIPSEDVSRNGDNIFYRIKSIKMPSKSDSNEPNSDHSIEACVTRQYKDFQWLYHHLSTGNDIGGIIMPPVPDKVGNSELEARRIMAGLRQRTDVGEAEATTLDCRKLQLFLNKVACHPYLAQDSHVEYFLTEQETPERFPFKKRFIGNMVKLITDLRHQSHKDREPDFRQYRNAINNACIYWKNANQSFSQLIRTQRKTAVAVITLASRVVRAGTKLVGNENSGWKLIQSFGECLNFCKEAIDVGCHSSEMNLGVILNYYADYCEEAKNMLYRRTIRMIDYDSALRIHEKAKPKYQESVSREYYVTYWKAEAKRKETKDAYEQTTETAKNELKRFSHARSRDVKDELLKFAEFQLAAAHDCAAIISSVLVSLRELSPKQ